MTDNGETQLVDMLINNRIIKHLDNHDMPAQILKRKTKCLLLPIRISKHKNRIVDKGELFDILY